MTFPRATEIAHLLVKSRLRHGDHAVDATVGNGHDTLFLAECVGTEGRVDGFDIQKEAIQSARERLTRFSGVFLHHLGHETMGQVVTTPIAAAMFNLGYFPSGDKTIITGPATTIPALATALGLLSEKGLLTVVIYPGHPGGMEEALEIENWVKALAPDVFRAIHYGPTGASNRAVSPFLIAIERSGSREKSGSIYGT